ncbi:hypothetical protein UY286_04800 [Paenibacillus polymyxa]|uniref:hypothetical protein n=1 Tax=Paenibacillus polymyxa TaxID=1406 RepID=UPI002AB4ED17|nr:hypothetical protein [Paenibacillus polymyxa]MDY7989884.1 hypothetical protein [Paenibacillus polymyxa]MDY8116757.1 hypothetical protein [Paenibacillus polymyxa]
MSKYSHLKKDFEEMKKWVRELPETAHYLDGPEVAVGQMILARQLEMGYSQRQLADLAGVSLEDVTVIQAGLTHPNFGQIVQSDSLAKIFKVLKIIGVRPIVDEEAASSIMH